MVINDDLDYLYVTTMMSEITEFWDEYDLFYLLYLLFIIMEKFGTYHLQLVKARSAESI